MHLELDDMGVPPVEDARTEALLIQSSMSSPWTTGDVSEKVRPPVYYASFLGLDSVPHRLLYEEPSDRPFHGPDPSKLSGLVNAEDGHYGAALQAASEGGREAVVWLLLDKGAQQMRPRALTTSAGSSIRDVLS